MSMESSLGLPGTGSPNPSVPSLHPVDVQAEFPLNEEIEDKEQAAVIRRAMEVLGDRADAMRWLGTPVRALSYATPISLLHDSKGCQDVLSVLGRLEHGVL